MVSARKIVDDYYVFLKERDREKLLALLSPDIVVTYHAQGGEFPWGGVFKDITGFDEFFSIIKDHLNIVEVKIIDSIEGDNKIVNQCLGSWEIKKSGHVVTGSMVNIFTISNGRISAYDVYADTAAFAQGMAA